VILDRLDDRFTCEQLSRAIAEVRDRLKTSGKTDDASESLLSLARNNYRLELPPGTALPEVVIIPQGDNERQGIEDLRLVLFRDDDGSSSYYGTYTAFNGYRIFPQLMEYRTGSGIQVRVLTGSCAKNKGMALFPRKVRGRYAMVARLDNENLHFMQSDDVLVWEEAEILQTPKYPWEIVQIGNCGSPMETPRGWLLLTHGVGPMRRYCIGATLLDRGDPRVILGRTKEPLLVPSRLERYGYVPNVVYSCGGMIHENMVILPFALNDAMTSLAVLDLEELLDTLEPPPGD
jgi:predicted GH43/DUF377 family glycosyl hydrolase